MKLHGIYEKVVGVPASSLSQLRGPWPENVEDPWFRLTCVYTVCIGIHRYRLNFDDIIYGHKKDSVSVVPLKSQ